MTGLLYSLYYNNFDIATLLLETEFGLYTKYDIYLPLAKANKFQQPILNNYHVKNIFEQLKIKYYCYIPRNSSILDFCVITNNTKALSLIFNF